MSTRAEYFILMAILFVGYAGIRLVYVYYIKNLPPIIPPESVDFTGKALEMDQISGRIRHLRGDFTEASPPAPSASEQRAWVMENKRMQLSQLSFLHPPPPASKPPEDEHRLHLLLV